MSPSARRRTVTASACVPAFPPIPAMIGIQIASATVRCTVPWNRYTTPPARNAVSRFRYSQGSRLRTAVLHPAANSSSAGTPPNLSRSSVVSASTTSITSSKVMRPNSRPASSTTATLGRLYRARSRATSSWSWSGVTVMSAGTIRSRIRRSGRLMTTLLNGSSPTSRRSASTTNT